MNFSNFSSTASCRVMQQEHFLENVVATFLSVTLNLASCPVIILMNVLVIVAIKTRRRLQTKYNILLACLAVTDLVVGLVSQPMFIAQEIYLLTGGALVGNLCLTIYVLLVPCIESLLILALLSMERYLAMKYSLRYDSIVTTPRLTAAVVSSWVISLMPLILRFIAETSSFSRVVIEVSILSSIAVILFCHITVYFVSRRHMNQIKSEQIARETKAKFLEERKALITTSTILAFLFLSYTPTIIYGVLRYTFPKNYSAIWLPFATSAVLLNSFVNPFIYCWRNKDLRKVLLEFFNIR